MVGLFSCSSEWRRNIVYTGCQFLVQHIHAILVVFYCFYGSNHIASRFFFFHLFIDEPVETVDKSLGMESSTRIVPVAADGSVTLEAVAGSGPNIPAVRAVLSLNSGKAEKFVRWDFSDALLAVRTGGIRTIPAETAGKFALNMIVNPSFVGSRFSA